MGRFLRVFILLLLVGGCAVTRMTSFTDPDFIGKKQAKSVMVFGQGMMLGERQLAENTLVAEFSKLGVKAVRAIDYLPPTRKHSAQDEARIIRNAGVGTILFLVLAGKDTTSSYVPPTYFPGTTTTHGTVMGNTLYAQSYSTPGYTVGGYSVEKPVAGYVATLVDVATGKTIWRAEGQSKGSAFNTFEDLTVSASQETVLRLKEDGLF